MHITLSVQLTCVSSTISLYIVTQRRVELEMIDASPILKTPATALSLQTVLVTNSCVTFDLFLASNITDSADARYSTFTTNRTSHKQLRDIRLVLGIKHHRFCRRPLQHFHYKPY
ncbi:hypothetical protein J6590_084925 [Homalodisca vitripennis]|nr:hypothetical protein J6590_084925 [Homalodisca vitripennis]